MDKLVIAQHDEMSEEEILTFGSLWVHGAKALRQRQHVLVFRLQEALGFDETVRDGLFGPKTSRVLLSRLGLQPEATFEERLAALGEHDLGGELQTIIVQKWKETGDNRVQLA